MEYVLEIIDKGLFDFWITSMEGVGYVHVMGDGAPYHKVQWHSEENNIERMVGRVGDWELGQLILQT